MKQLKIESLQKIHNRNLDITSYIVDTEHLLITGELNIIPRICEQFSLEISKLRAFEVWPQHKDDSKFKYTEIVISEVQFDGGGDWILQNSWKPADKKDAMILEQLIETVGDKVILEEK